MSSQIFLEFAFTHRKAKTLIEIKNGNTNLILFVLNNIIVTTAFLTSLIALLW